MHSIAPSKRCAGKKVDGVWIWGLHSTTPAVHLVLGMLVSHFNGWVLVRELISVIDVRGEVGDDEQRARRGGHGRGSFMLDNLIVQE